MVPTCRTFCVPQAKDFRVHFYLEVSLPKDVIEQTLRALAALRIHLTPPEEDGRWIEFDAPQQVVLEPGLGVRACRDDWPLQVRDGKGTDPSPP